MIEATREQLGKYTLVKHLATGGMAEIWLAEAQGPGGFTKQLVIKRVLGHLVQDPQFTQMFLDEARLVAQLTHPNIGQIFELGERDGAYFIAMEYIEGLDLSVIVEEARAVGEFVPIGVAVSIVVQMLQGLEYAHDFADRDGTFAGLVHRDVTPHNVIVSNDGVVKLVDFGVAKAKANQSKTQTGAVKGKFAYMAPEQIADKSLDRRVDLFAAGVVLYEILTGEKPFGDDLYAVHAIVNEPTPDPRDLRPETPQTLVNILDIAMAKDRAERYQSAQPLMADLEDFLRASNLYVAQRDIAAYVRELQGLEMTASWSMEDVAEGPRARITEREDAVEEDAVEEDAADSAEDTQDILPPPPSTGRTEPVTGQHAPHSMAGPPPKPTEQAASTNSSNLLLILGFGATILAILAAAAVVAYLAFSGDGSEEPSPRLPSPPSVATKQDPATSAAQQKADPTALMHEDGVLVFIDTAEKARVYYDGVYVGDTRLQTTLRPGSYTLVFDANGVKKAKVVEITDKPIQDVFVQGVGSGR